MADRGDEGQSGQPLRQLCEGQDPAIDIQNIGDMGDKKGAGCKMDDSAAIGSYMLGLLELYSRLRGQDPGKVGVVFWDLVVISAGDESQEAWYKAQLELKQESGDLPINVPFLCIADPPGPRIGSGGSTLHILDILTEQFRDKLDSWKILIIHAGGYSKRLPSHSCSGKIFSPLPIRTGTSGNTGGPYQMLDLKLAMYLPFIKIMEPGVFITASDDIEVFNISSLECGGGKGETITALAHPSSLYIGTTHGVYVMKDLSMEHNNLQDLSPCLEVLQKPSVDKMRARGAVLSKGDQGEKVYSDSAFWFHTPTTRKLVQLYKDVRPLTSELCIYGDLLTCLGEREDKDYVGKLLAMDQGKEDVVLKRKVLDEVGDTRLAILSLHQSKFYHLGTTQEYLHGLTGDKSLRVELNLENVVCSKLEDQDSQVLGILLNSVIKEKLFLAQDSIVEYSVFDAKVSIGPKTILSNIYIEHDLVIPPGFLYHTVPIKEGDKRLHVTVAFHHTDDMKYTTGLESAANLQFGGRLLDQLFTKAPDKFSSKTVFGGSPTVSLWNAKLFTSHSTMSGSFKDTVNMVGLLSNKDTLGEHKKTRLYSMEDLVKLKDCEGILDYRKMLLKMYK